MKTPEAAARHLTVVITHWPDLQAALGTRAPATWPPAGRMSEYLSSLAELDAEMAEAAQHRAHTLRTMERDPDQVGASTAPLRIPLLDTMTRIETDLIHLADATAAVIQRPPYRARGGRVWTDALHRQVEADATDARRWHPDRARTPVAAATWLRARIEGHPGPVIALTPELRQSITVAAKAAAASIEHALDLVDHTDHLAQRCPVVHENGIRCGGLIQIQGGGGESPMARCGSCGRLWTPYGTAARA